MDVMVLKFLYNKPDYSFPPLARISLSTNSQRAIESSKKKPGCFAEEEERQGCWEEELPGVPSERKQSSKEERSPENSGKGSSPQPPGQQLHLFWILSISDYHVSKEKDQITFTHKRPRVVRNWNLFAAITSWERCWRLRKSEERAEWGPSIFHLCDLNFRNILGQRRLRRNKIFWLTSKTRRREGGNDARTSSVF